MDDVTHILAQVETGDATATERLLPLVYDELRKLAAAKMAREKPGQTLQATALVHEAYLKLIGVDVARRWESRGHFFAAAAEAMRRILVDQARKKKAEKRGGDYQQVPMEGIADELNLSLDDFLDLNDALSRLEESAPDTAQLVKLRVFAGLSVEDAAQSLGLAARTAYREWTFAQAWLLRELRGKHG
jgi:RNA polymerase sigma factor (TIGR02999 family)